MTMSRTRETSESKKEKRLAPDGIIAKLKLIYVLRSHNGRSKFLSDNSCSLNAVARANSIGGGSTD